MSTAVVLALDLVATLLAAGSWLAAGGIAWPLLRAGGRRAASHALLLSGAGVLLSLAHVLLVAVLLPRGWWFVQEQVVLGIPLLVLAAAGAVVLAVPALTRVMRGRAETLRPPIPVALVSAGLAAAVCAVSRLAIGYPLGVASAAVLLVLWAIATGLAAAIAVGARVRVVSALAGLGVITLATSLGLAWLTSLTSAPQLPGGHAHAAAHEPAAPGMSATAVSVADLRTPAVSDAPVRRFDLVAARSTVELPSGAEVDAWTFNGLLPGPELRVTEGDLVEATLSNRDIPGGVTIHWHGVDVPNGEDGVAGVTQDAVLPGESFTYRFVADEPGTYWYHTHQASAEGVGRGLFGTLVVEPADGVPEELDLAVPLHTFRSSTFGASDVPVLRAVAAGTSVRLRILDTDQEPLRVQLDGTPFRVVAVDGRDLEGGAPVAGRGIRLPAGGRVDLSFVMPDGPVTLWRDGSDAVWLTLSPDGSGPAGPPQDVIPLDLLGYTSTGAAPPAGIDGHLVATMVLDRLPRVLGGLPGYGYTVDGAVAPRIPSIVVREGQALTLTVINRGWETHPMHIHGHHVRVISRDGVAATAGLWLDTFDVQPGEVWVVELFADNPGIWMDHCHNLAHAAAGMTMSLVYRGVTSPYALGGWAGNRPE